MYIIDCLIDVLTHRKFSKNNEVSENQYQVLEESVGGQE